MWYCYNNQMKLKIHIFHLQNHFRDLQSNSKGTESQARLQKSLPTVNISQIVSHNPRWVSSQFQHGKTHSLSESCDSLTVTILRYIPAPYPCPSCPMITFCKWLRETASTKNESTCKENWKYLIIQLGPECAWIQGETICIQKRL